PSHALDGSGKLIVDGSQVDHLKLISFAGGEQGFLRIQQRRDLRQAVRRDSALLSDWSHPGFLCKLDPLAKFLVPLVKNRDDFASAFLDILRGVGGGLVLL